MCVEKTVTIFGKFHDLKAINYNAETNTAQEIRRVIHPQDIKRPLHVTKSYNRVFNLPMPVLINSIITIFRTHFHTGQFSIKLRKFLCFCQRK